MYSFTFCFSTPLFCPVSLSMSVSPSCCLSLSFLLSDRLVSDSCQYGRTPPGSAVIGGSSCRNGGCTIVRHPGSLHLYISEMFRYITVALMVYNGTEQNMSGIFANGPCQKPLLYSHYARRLYAICLFFIRDLCRAYM